MSDRLERNQVFAQQSAAGQQSQEGSYLDVPVESVPLPSLGAVYPVDHPLHGAETVEIRAMTAREEDILSSRALIRKGTVITELLRSCIVNRGVDVRGLLGGDRNAIMVALRITGYGPDYSVEVPCGACSFSGKYSYDLAGLAIKRLSIQPVELGQNAFEARLPVTGKLVRFKFLTGADEEEILTAQERRRKALGPQAADNMITSKLQACLLSAEGVPDRTALARFVANMPARDSLFLRKHIDASEPGVEMTVDFECASCSHREAVALPLGPGFFWPDA